MGRKKVKISTKKLLEAIKGSRGIVSAVAINIQHDWKTTNRLIEESSEAKEALRIEREINLDQAESKLFAALDRGDMDTIKWFLAKIGKNRGYGDSIAVEDTSFERFFKEFEDMEKDEKRKLLDDFLNE